MSSRGLFGSLHAGSPTPADMEFVEDINIKIDSDTEVCSCTDLCLLPDGTLIVLDWNNKNIKSFTYGTTYKVNDSLRMSNRPWGVCLITDDDIAVTVPGDKTVYIVCTEPEMAIKSSFIVDYSCNGIEFNEGILYIVHSLDKQLKVYDLEGNCLHTYHRDQNGGALFSGPLHLCVIKDQQQIAVTDEDKGLVVIDMSGQFVTEHDTYTNRQLTYGVCIDDQGNLIFTDNVSKQILTVGMDRTCRTLQTNSDKHPLSVFFDKQSKKLLVALYENDFIRTFTLKYSSY